MSHAHINIHTDRDKSESGRIEIFDMPVDPPRCSVQLLFGEEEIIVFANGSGQSLAERISKAFGSIASEFASIEGSEIFAVEYTFSPATERVEG